MNATAAARTSAWRYAILLLIALGTLALLPCLPAIRQNPDYHLFADQRRFLGIPNWLDVLSNAGFLAVGAAGLWLGVQKRFAGGAFSWNVFFAGVALVGLGSGYYHLQPTNQTLVWDRLPMTVAFMAMFAALVGEYTVERAGRILLVPALIAGVLSVLHWYYYDDLRVYAWVQFFPLLSIPLLMVLFRARYTHSLLLLSALGAYVVAKVLESFDHQVFAFTGRMVSGHTLKHVFAAAGCLLVLEMLRRRKGVVGRGA